MTTSSPPCPKCNSAYAYQDGSLWTCPECAHEWSGTQRAGDDEAVTAKIWRDANGTELKDGDSVTVIKDLKFKGGVVKVGTKVTNIRLVHGDHDIDCKVPGFGPMGLKTQFVRKIAD